MSFCSCLLVDELMLSPSHRSVSTSNVDFLISIVGVLSSDAELLLLLSSALQFAKRGEKERIKRLFIFLFIESFFEFQASSFQKIYLTSLKYLFNLLLRAFHVDSNFSVEISQFLSQNLQQIIFYYQLMSDENDINLVCKNLDYSF